MKNKFTKKKFDIYSKKVVDIKFLKKLKKNKDKKIIMCHGVFDVVHPGHVRHLVYAKQKADLLVVSITADIHIKKVYIDHLFLLA